MLAIVKSITLHGLDGRLMSVEVDISRRITKLGYCRTSRYKCKGVKRKNKSGNKKYWFKTRK